VAKLGYHTIAVKPDYHTSWSNQTTIHRCQTRLPYDRGQTRLPYIVAKLGYHTIAVKPDYHTSRPPKLIKYSYTNGLAGVVINTRSFAYLVHKPALCIRVVTLCSQSYCV